MKDTEESHMKKGKKEDELAETRGKLHEEKKERKNIKQKPKKFP